MSLRTLYLVILCSVVSFGSVCRAQPNKAEASASSKAVQLTQEGMEVWLYDKPYHSRSTFERSLALFEQAIEVDSTYALAYASMVHPLFMLGLEFPDQAETYQAKARHAAQKALDLDPDLADAIYAKAILTMMYDNDYETGGAEMEKAVTMAPDKAYIQREYAIYLGRMGRLEESIPVYEKISKMDPDFGAAHAGGCNAMRLTGLGKVALEKWESNVDKSIGLIVCLSNIYHEKNQYDQALSLLEKGLVEHPDAINLKGMKAYTLVRDRQFDKGIELFGEIGNAGGVMMGEALKGDNSKKMETIDALSERIEQGQWGWDLAMADLYRSMDKLDEALDLYEKAYEVRAALPSKEALMEYNWLLKYHDDTASLREEPRIQALLSKI